MARRGSKSNNVIGFTPDMRLVVLAGKDRFSITEATQAIIQSLEEAHGEIERFDLDGETAELAAVLDELRSYGLIQRHKLVILDRADVFLSEKGPAKDRARPAMESYAANPVDSATLLMRAETWRVGKIDKLIAKVGMVQKFEAPKEADAVSWCVRRAKDEYGTPIEPEAATRLVELTGPDLGRLDTELAKLAASIMEPRPIDSNDVAGIVGMSREDQVWSLQKPIAAGETAEAMRRFHELLTLSRQPDSTRVMIAWALCDLCRKLHAASQLLRQSAHQGTIVKALRLWGDSQRPILEAARRVEPEVFAELLDQAIRTDLGTKSGLGEATRSLEVLTMQIADSMKRS